MNSPEQRQALLDGDHLVRDNEGVYRGRGHILYAVGDGKFLLERVEQRFGIRRGADNPTCCVRSVDDAEKILDWRDELGLERVAVRRDGTFPDIPGCHIESTGGTGQTGAQDWVLDGAPAWVEFYRLGNARAFLAVSSGG